MLDQFIQEIKIQLFLDHTVIFKSNSLGFPTLIYHLIKTEHTRPTLSKFVLTFQFGKQKLKRQSLENLEGCKIILL